MRVFDIRHQQWKWNHPKKMVGTTASAIKMDPKNWHRNIAFVDENKGGSIQFRFVRVIKDAKGQNAGFVYKPVQIKGGFDDYKDSLEQYTAVIYAD